MRIFFSCCHHCDLGDDWHIGRYADNHEDTCPYGCSEAEE